MAPYVKKVIEENRLLDGTYIEPFAGGAGIAWSLLFSEHVKRVLINDINPAVHAFWISVFYNTDQLCSLITKTLVTTDEWHRQREVQASPGDCSTLELGFSTFFLNRTNRSGILKGGVIGGQRQTGKWKIDARFNKEDLVARIRRIARYGSRVSIFNLEAEQFLDREVLRSHGTSLTYLDPPYESSGSDLYENHFQENDHIRLSELLRQFPECRWMVSYDHTPTISKLYSGLDTVRLRVSYSAQLRYGGNEAVFFSPALHVPVLDGDFKRGKALVRHN